MNLLDKLEEAKKRKCQLCGEQKEENDNPYCARCEAELSNKADLELEHEKVFND